jgi:hypothetical protein
MMASLRQLFEQAVYEVSDGRANDRELVIDQLHFSTAAREAIRLGELAGSCEARELATSIVAILHAMQADLVVCRAFFAAERAHARFEGLLAQYRVPKPSVAVCAAASSFHWPAWLMGDAEAIAGRAG